MKEDRATGQGRSLREAREDNIRKDCSNSKVEKLEASTRASAYKVQTLYMFV